MAKKRAEPVKPSETLAVPNEKQFAALVRAVRSHEADKNEAVGSLGAAIKNAVEKQHLDRKAFGIFRGLMRMSDKKLATTLAHLEHYCSIGGLTERAARQGDMIGREAELAEADVKAVAPNGGRKKRGAGKKAKGTVVPFDTQREREAAGEFEDGVAGEAVH
jgi:hypothetical protein